mmetsp:Transcript_8207/g.21639  ORF Transcript_8207/g.21639 Transcript_8207/m.21639 type:complete len:219 (+) Transcript_8207:1105-1761(+)
MPLQCAILKIHLEHRALVSIRLGVRAPVIERFAQVAAELGEEADDLAVRDVLDPLPEARQDAVGVLVAEAAAVEHLEVGAYDILAQLKEDVELAAARALEPALPHAPRHARERRDPLVDVRAALEELRDFHLELDVDLRGDPRRHWQHVDHVLQHLLKAVVELKQHGAIGGFALQQIDRRQHRPQIHPHRVAVRRSHVHHKLVERIAAHQPSDDCPRR